MNRLLLTFFLVLLFTLPLFAQSVDTAWVRRYNGSGNGTDGASAIAVDSSGSVYVTGTSTGSGSSFPYDYSTIKYYSNGDTAWVRRYNGPGNGNDGANAIAVDGSGSVYVTGYSYGDAMDDYATIKYYANGDTAWVRRYDANYDPDEASAIAVDASGNVYVTGKSIVSIFPTYYDYATIKYYPNGDTAWVRRYNSPWNGNDRALAIAVDGSGNVYVTGTSNDDYVTVKYKSNGDTAWVRRFNGTGNGNDSASAIAVDASGYVYVTGSSPGSGTSFDYATIRYNPNGDTAWVRRYNGTGNGNEEASAIAVDGSGNVYVTGYSYAGGTGADYVTIKYYPNGDTAWVRRYNGPGNGTDATKAIAVDISGQVYVTGGSVGRWTDYDYATIKYVQFLRGDADHDGIVNVSDVVYLISYLFKRGPVPIPGTIVGDANCDGKVTIADVVYLVSYLFKHGTVPCI